MNAPRVPRAARAARRPAWRSGVRGCGRRSRPASSWPARCRCRSRSGCRCRCRRSPGRWAGRDRRRALPDDPAGGPGRRSCPGCAPRSSGYDGIFPGPTIEARRGRPVVVRHRNELPVPTVVHLHGGHTPRRARRLAARPGAAGRRHRGGWARHHGMVGDLAAGERDYRYPYDQRAATLWYHDHRMDFTGPAVYRGLAGFHLVRDDVEDALPLPRGDARAAADDLRPGVRRRRLVRLSRAGPGDAAAPGRARPTGWRGCSATWCWSTGRRGRCTRWTPRATGCGCSTPPTPAATGSVLHRAGRAGPAVRRRSGRTAVCSRRRWRSTAIEVAPGERFDVVVDFSVLPVGTEVTMVNALGAGSAARRDAVPGGAHRPRRQPDARAARRVRAAGAGAGRTAADVPVHPRRRSVTTRGWTINGTAFDPNRRSADIPLGEIEMWRFVTDVHHPVHVHLDAFQVLRRGSGGPGPIDARLEGHRRPAPGRDRGGGGAVHRARRAGTCCTATTWSTRTWR